jgi:hypothetical protein
MSRPEREVALPVGVADETGAWRRRATIRKMSGHEEALLCDASLSAGRLVTQLIAGCLLRLDDAAAVTPALVSRMYSADRNFLLLEIRRFTFGDAMACGYRCPACGEQVPALEDLARMPVRRCDGDAPPQAAALVLEDGYRDRDGVLHKDMRIRLPRGDDEEFVSETAERDPLRARDALILRCIESFGTLPRAALEAYGVRILRDLAIGDRNAIYRALDAEAPGIDLRRRLDCPGCGARFETAVDATNFFLLA